MSKRILLMYISEISGHHSATLAIESAIRKFDSSAQILNVNSLSYANPIGGRLINKLYIGVIKRCPNFWGWMYDNPKVISFLEPMKNFLHKKSSSRIDKLMKNFKPDVVVFSQAYPCGIVAHYKRINKLDIPLVAVLTDYAPHSYWVYEEVNYYIVPSQEAKERLMQKGVAADRIKLLGIPIDIKFLRVCDRHYLYKKYGFDPDSKTVLLMGGGHGLGPIDEIAWSLNEKISQDFQIIAVTGINKRASSRLKKLKKEFKKRILIFEYTDNINELMDMSDIIITKAGGLTTAESLAKGLAMVIVNPIPGQEINNTNFLVEKNIACSTNSLQEVIDAVNCLISDKQELFCARSRARDFGRPTASLDIAKLLLEL